MTRIRELRQNMGWTQDDLALRLNTKRQTVGHYETGTRSIDAAILCSLCDIFGCTSDYLLGRSNLAHPVISESDANLLLAYHAAPPSVASAINTLLQPYQKESEADQAI